MECMQNGVRNHGRVANTDTVSLHAGIALGTVAKAHIVAVDIAANRTCTLRMQKFNGLLLPRRRAHACTYTLTLHDALPILDLTNLAQRFEIPSEEPVIGTFRSQSQVSRSHCLSIMFPSWNVCRMVLEITGVWQTPIPFHCTLASHLERLQKPILSLLTSLPTARVRYACKSSTVCYFPGVEHMHVHTLLPYTTLFRSWTLLTWLNASRFPVKSQLLGHFDLKARLVGPTACLLCFLHGMYAEWC